MKKVFFMAVVLAASMIFAGCEKENKDSDDGGDDGSGVLTVTATLSNLPEEANSVRVMVHLYESFYFNDMLGVASEFKGDILTMSFPNPILDLESWYFTSGKRLLSKHLRGATLSNPNVQGCYIGEDDITAIQDFGSSIRTLGYIRCGTEDGNTDVSLYYVDGDVNCTGSGQGEYDNDVYQYNTCHLKKGWNYVVRTYKGRHSGTYYPSHPVMLVREIGIRDVSVIEGI